MAAGMMITAVSERCVRCQGSGVYTFLHFTKPLNYIMEFCKSGLEGNNMMLINYYSFLFWVFCTLLLCCVCCFCNGRGKVNDSQLQTKCAYRYK